MDKTEIQGASAGRAATYREVRIHQRCEAWIRRLCAQGGGGTAVSPARCRPP